MPERESRRPLISASIRLRPTRIGFLVNPLDSDTLLKVLQTCTMLWGGAYNPIIPVSEELPVQWRDTWSKSSDGLRVATGLAHFFEPDVYVECAEGLAARARIRPADLDFGLKNVATLADFTDRGGGATSMPFGTDVSGIYRDAYRREFQFLRRRKVEAVSFKPDSGQPLLVAALFGSFPADGPWSGLGKLFCEAFDTEERDLTPGAFREARDARAMHPLGVTAHDLTREPDGEWDRVFFILDPRNTLDIIDYWNLRLFRRGVVGLSVDWLPCLRGWLVDQIRANHRPLPGNPNGIMIRTVLQFGRSLTPERIEQAIAAAGLSALSSGEWAQNQWYEPIWLPDSEDMARRPRRAVVTAGKRQADFAAPDADGEPVCQFEALSPPFADEFGDNRARWVNVARLSSFGSEGNWSTVLVPGSTERLRHRIRMGNALLTSREGFVLPQGHVRNREFLRLCTGREVLSDLFASAGMEATQSQAGRTADQVIEALMGVSGARLIADRETIELLDNMARSRRRNADGSTEVLPDRTMDASRWRGHVKARSARALFRNTSLDDFIKANILRLGLSLMCPNCRMENRYAIGGILEENVCERCLRRFPFPQGSLNFKNTPWSYRVVGPFAVRDLAGGAYATVLTLRAFLQNLAGLDRGNAVYATGTNLRDPLGGDLEADFALIYQRRGFVGEQDDSHLVLGETKSFAAEAFTAQDVGRMRRLGARFPGAVLVFATLKDALDPEERASIGELAAEGNERLDDGRPRNPVVILTGFELFAEWHIDRAWRQDEGDRATLAHSALHFENLWTLAELTQARYLGIKRG